jgi:hypothetical protein
VSGCSINEQLVGHAYGRNDVTIAEIKRRFGAKVVADAYEANRRWQERQETASQAGRAEAKKDLSEGRLVVEVYEAFDVTEYAKLFRERYGIELRRVGWNGAPNTDERIYSHATGYNEVSEAEIDRRFGKDARNALTCIHVSKPFDDFAKEGH